MSVCLFVNTFGAVTAKPIATSYFIYTPVNPILPSTCSLTKW